MGHFAKTIKHGDCLRYGFRNGTAASASNTQISQVRFRHIFPPIYSSLLFLRADNAAIVPIRPVYPYKVFQEYTTP
jgi:hypothetical protein